ncbi:MAG: FAD-dependent monooxygenase, partial [Pseudomonadota bacterium]|nr:FAD-dependent monooxygenase [Pseudomonadota bacterium]
DESSPVRVMVTEAQVGSGDPASKDISEGLVRVYGTDYGFTPAWLSRFTDATRQAAAYRKNRVLLAGDAAHIHSPVGGQGLNLGVQDAMNLGWKLAQVVKGTSPESLLDTYHAERHPVAARALRTTMAAVALMRNDERTKALNETLAELLGVDAARNHMAGLLSGLDIRYELGTGHPLVGRRMPDLDVETDDGRTRVYALMHDARPLLLNFGAADDLPDLSTWASRLRIVNARYDGTWELPVVGEVAAPAVVLIRPDGYVAWADVRGASGLADALHRWASA